MKIFSIAGWSGSGKTTLILRLIEAFKEKNIKVLAVKNIPHKYHLEPETKDSYKFLNAGCSEVFLVARDEIVSMQKNNKPGKIFDILQATTAGSDVVLLEGLVHDGIPVIEVFDAQQHEKPKYALDKLSALVIVSAAANNNGYNKEYNKGNYNYKDILKINRETTAIPVFDFDDINGVIQFLEDYHG